MSHFAKVINGIVVTVNAATQEWVDEQPDKDNWIETSYNIHGGIYYNPETGLPHPDQSLIYKTAGRQRKNYAAIDFIYDKEKNAFIPPQPYPSWLLNDETCYWEAPIPYPQDNKEYIWNEAQQEWTYTGYKIVNGQLIKEE